MKTGNIVALLGVLAACLNDVDAALERPQLRMDSYAYPLWEQLPVAPNLGSQLHDLFRLMKDAKADDLEALERLESGGDNGPNEEQLHKWHQEVEHFYSAARFCVEELEWSKKTSPKKFDSEMAKAELCRKELLEAMLVGDNGGHGNLRH